MNALSVVSSRPLLVAIGPQAAAVVAAGHPDLELVDVIALREPVSDSELVALERIGMFDRAHVACLFDVTDESLWRSARCVADLARNSTACPVWFVCADQRWGCRPRASMRRLAAELHVCVIDPGHRALDVALMPAAALYRPGIIGFDRDVLAAIAPVGSVATLSPMAAVPRRRIDAAIMVVRATSETSLEALNDAVNWFSIAAPEATLVLAVPGIYATGSITMLEVCVQE